MKICICNRCQFRTLDINKICRTCGSSEFTTYDVTTECEEKETNEFPQGNWKDSILALWNSLLKSIHEQPASPKKVVQDFSPTASEDL